MHTFVYGSRVIENEQQIRLERKVQKFGNFVGTVVKFCVAFFLFVSLNALLSNLAQHTNLFSLNTYINTYRFIQEATRVLFVDNAFTTTSFIYQFAISLITAAFVSVAGYGLVLRTLGSCNEHGKEEQDDHKKSEQHPQTVNSFGTVSYKLKVCFLS